MQGGHSHGHAADELVHELGPELCHIRVGRRSGLNDALHGRGAGSGLAQVRREDPGLLTRVARRGYLADERALCHRDRLVVAGHGHVEDLRQEGGLGAEHRVDRLPCHIGAGGDCPHRCGGIALADEQVPGGAADAAAGLECFARAPPAGGGCFPLDVGHAIE